MTPTESNMLRAVRIRMHLRRAGLNSKQAAARLSEATGLKIDAPRFSRIINGRSPRALEQYAPQLAEIAGVSVEEILAL